MANAISEKYLAAQQRIRDGFWRVDTVAGVIHGVGDKPLLSPAPDGYVRCAIRLQSRIVYVMAHRVIWESVHGMLDPSIEVNHINGIKNDNRLLNLEAATSSENMQHAYRTGLYKRRAGRDHLLAKLTDTDVVAIDTALRRGERHNVLALQYGVSVSTIGNIKRGWTWSHLTGRKPPSHGA